MTSVLCASLLDHLKTSKESTKESFSIMATHQHITPQYWSQNWWSNGSHLFYIPFLSRIDLPGLLPILTYFVNYLKRGEQWQVQIIQPIENRVARNTSTIGPKSPLPSWKRPNSFLYVCGREIGTFSFQLVQNPVYTLDSAPADFIFVPQFEKLVGGKDIISKSH